MKKFANLSLKKKIALLFTAVMVANALVTASAYYAFQNGGITADFEDNAQDMVKQLELYLGDKVTGLTERVTALGNNLSFAEPMRTFLHDDTVNADPVLAGNVARMITEVKTSEKFVDSVYIYTEKGTFDDYMMIRKKNVSFADTDMYHTLRENPNLRTAWFPAMEDPVYDTAEPVIPVVYRMELGSRDVFFVVNLSQSAIQAYIEQGYRSLDQVFLVEESGQTVLSLAPDQEAVLKAFSSEERQIGSKRLSLNGEEYLAVRTRIPENGWYIYGLMSLEGMAASQRQFRTFLIAENAIVLLAGLAVIVWLSDRLTVSLAALAKAMNGAVKSGYHTEFSYAYQDEIGMLAGSYNHMIQEIRQHIQALEEEKERVRQMEKQKRKAQLQALQAQINPHFLYNTLNMVTWRAVEIGDEPISIISTALGEYFRIGLSRGQEIISLKDELEHVRSYLEIQKIRYEEKLNYSFSVPEDLDGLRVVKLTLQPLVENAIYHGIKEKCGSGNIQILVERRENTLTMTVSDDGIGLPEDKLRHINENLASGRADSSSGYGIYNVNNRLRLYYGEEYGLRLERNQGQGIRSVVTLPAVEGEEDNDVPYRDR